MQRTVQVRSGSFERGSRRKADHAVAESINKHLTCAQENHKERCGCELDKREELASLIQLAMGQPANPRESTSAPRLPELELIALLEGHLESEAGSRQEHAEDAAIWQGVNDQLTTTGFQLVRGAGRGSVLHALSAALGVAYVKLAANVADKLDSMAGGDMMETAIGSVNVLDFITWGRLPDTCVDGESESPETKWQALSNYIREDETLDQVGADWLILALASLTMDRNILVYHAGFDVAVRFTPDDTLPGGFVLDAQLAPGEHWVQLAMLDGQCFVPMEPRTTRAHGLLSKLDKMTTVMNEQIQRADGSPAVMLLGLTGVGKSTMMHVLSGRQMYLVDDGINSSVKVLDGCIPGSTISQSSNSETKMANAIRIHTPTSQEEWLLIDTPGFNDTEKEDNIVNALSIAKVMGMCTSLRIVMLINQSDIVSTRLTSFVELGQTISKLFANFETASKSLAIWVPKKSEDGDVDVNRLTKKLNAAYKDKKNEDAQKLLGVLVRQLKIQPLRLIKYTTEEDGSDDDDDNSDDNDKGKGSDEKGSPSTSGSSPSGSTAPATKHPRFDGSPEPMDNDQAEDEDEVTTSKVTFEVDVLLGTLASMTPLDSPAEQVLLPLSSESQEYLKSVAREVRDLCEAAVELPNFGHIAQTLELLSRIVGRFKEVEPAVSATSPTKRSVGWFGRSTSAGNPTQAEAPPAIAREVKEATSIVDAQYVQAALNVKSRIEEQVELRMQRLSAGLSQTNLGGQLEPVALHAFSWACRCLAAAKLVDAHVKGLPVEDTLVVRFKGLLDGLCRQTMLLEVSDPAIKMTLIKIDQLRSYFPADASHRIFAEVGKAANEWHGSVIGALRIKMQALSADLLAHVNLGYQATEAMMARSISTDSVHVSTDLVHTDDAAAAHYDQAGTLLRTVCEAQQRLYQLAPPLNGMTETACSLVSERLQAWLEPVMQAAHGDIQLAPPQLIELTTQLAALGKVRSSFKLRVHFDNSEKTADGEELEAELPSGSASWAPQSNPQAANGLDALYESGIECIVSWHARVTEPVLEDVKKADAYSAQGTDFASRICEHRTALETAKQLFQLGSCPRTGLEPKLAEAIQGACAARQKDLEHRIHGQLEIFTKEAIAEVQDLDNVRSAYTDHRKKLTLLEQTVWWDCLAKEGTIGKALEAMWRAFHDRLSRLASGLQSVENRLRAGHYEAAAADFKQLCDMSPLWSALSVEQCGKAQELKDLFDTCITNVQKLIASKIASVQDTLLGEGPWSSNDPPSADKSFLDSLKRADQFIDFVTHIGPLEEWLQVGDLQRAGSLCKSKVDAEFKGMKARVLELTDAIAKGAEERLKAARGRAKDVPDVLRVLRSKSVYPVLFRMLYDQGSTGEGDYPDFVIIETAFFRSLKTASQNFARMKLTDQSVLTETLSDIERSLPATDPMLSALKKDLDTRHEAMAERHSTQIDNNHKTVISEFLKHTYSQQTFKRMQELRNSTGEHSDEFSDACLDLQTSLDKLIDDIETGIIIFKLTATNHLDALTQFDASNHIVQPWNSLKSALNTQHNVFIEINHRISQEVAAKEGTSPPKSFVLAEAIDKVSTQLHDNLKKSLEPLVAQFCEDELEDAATGIQKIATLVETLRSGHGLYEKAQTAIEEVRSKQKRHLEVLQTNGPFGEDGKSLKSWLTSRHHLLNQLDKLRRKGTMQTEYATTFRAIIKQISDTFHARLAPVLDPDLWQKLKKDELESSQVALVALRQWLKDAPSTVIQELALSDEQLDSADQRIQARKRSFVVVNFESKEPSEQAAIISDHLAMPAEYSDFVDKYRHGYQKVCHEVRAIANKPCAEWNSRELSTAMLRMRSYVQYDTFETAGAADLEMFYACENKLLEINKQAYSALNGMLQSLAVPSRDVTQHKPLHDHLKGYLEIVRLAVDSIERDTSNRMMDEGASASADPVVANFDKARSDSRQVLQQASEIFELLLKQLQTLQTQYMTPARCPTDLAVMGQALRRLQLWEGMPGEVPLLELIVQLEKHLPAQSASSLSADSTSPVVQTASDVVQLLGTHNKRVQNAGTVICGQLDQTTQLLQGSYDPETCPPLPKEPFELALCKQMDELVNELSWKVDEVRGKRATLSAQVQEQVANFNDAFNKLLSTQQYKQAGVALKDLKRFKYLMEMCEFQQCRGRPSDYGDKIHKHAENLKKEALDSLPSVSEPGDLGPQLIRLKMLEDAIPTATSFARAVIKELLSALQKKYPSGMIMLGAQLKSLNPVLGSAIVNSSETFAALRVTMFNARTAQQRFDDVLTRLTGEPRMDKPSLQHRYEQFEAQYEKDWKWALSPVNHGNELQHLAGLASSRTQLSMGKKAAAFIGFHANAQDEMPKVLAAIFAIWSVQFYLKTADPLSATSNPTIKKPHAVQVLCILRLLGAISADTIHLENHLAEVPTGEGKSVILAVTAAALALYNYRVDCVCYSGNLSSRDQDAFRTLFLALGLQDKASPLIRYGTFDELSERLMTEKHGPVRDQMQAALQGKKLTTSKLAKPPERVLLIDEVDVFLDPDFFGNIYRPSLMIHDKRAADLMRVIWANPSLKPTDLAEFKALFTTPAVVSEQYEWYAQSAAFDMQRSVVDFKKAPQRRGVDYELIDDWVWYKSQDSMVRSDKMTYSYMTNCVYLYEHERGSIKEESLIDHGVPLHAVCGEFSYALLPSTTPYCSVPAFYKFILGVTGTLSEGKLPREARDLLRNEVRIKHMTYCPSMYGALQRSFDPKNKGDVQVTPTVSEHRIAIYNEIIKRLKPTDPSYKGKRAVTVFFESVDELEQFYTSTCFQPLKDSANRLTETTAKEPEERDSLVSKATRQGQVTLATRSFGRGVDFIVDDEHMVTCGGLHVLLTFFPRDVQEEVQIMGRSGRQGEKGSFSMVVHSQQLEDLAGDKATADSIKAWVSNDSLYQQMSEIRSAQAAADMAERLAKAAEAKKKHDEVATALNTFQQRHSSKELCKLLKSYNFVGSSTTSRTLILIDVTFSMESLIEKTKACIGDFFDRCQRVLDDQGIVSGFELQLAGYSNYNAPVEQILEASTWEVKPHNLAQWLTHLKVRGGWSEEAIEVGLMHALNEHKKRHIDQIIIIGDAPANTLSDIDYKRDEAYWAAQTPDWSSDGIPKKDAPAMVLEIQGVKPVPLHCYWMRGRAQQSFEQLADATGGGTAQKLDVNSQAGAQLLTDAVCKQILSSLGGQALADAYERMKPSFSR